MTFKSVESLSFPQPYKAINEDAFFVSEDLAVVIDGATGLCPARLPGVQSDAAWFSHSIVHELRASWTPGSDFPSVLEHCLKRLCAQWVRLTGSGDLGPIEFQPVAAMSAVQHKGQELVFYRLSDCSAFVRSKNVGCAVFAPSVLSSHDARNIQWMAENRSDGMDPAAALKMSMPLVVKTRSATNSGQGIWALSLDGAAVSKMDVFRLPLTEAGEPLEVILTSDGFSALIDDYLPSMGESCTQLCSKSLSSTYNLVRDIEKTDPLGLRFPRFKTHDDATAIRVLIC